MEQEGRQRITNKRVDGMEAELIHEARAAGYTIRQLATRFKRSPTTIAIILHPERRTKWNEYWKAYHARNKDKTKE